MPAQRRVVRIDGDCSLCTGFVAFVSRRDRRRLFEFLPGNQTNTVLLEEGGVTYARSAAVLRVLHGLGFPWSWLARAGAVVPARFRDSIYDWVARHRRSLACPIK